MLSRQTDGHYRVDSELTFRTVTALRGQGLAALAAAPAEVVFDLAAVRQADSAGLALLIDWLAARLRFAGVSPELRALARLSDVEDLLAP
jgi:phospholipid transport system transporter-binding protein